MRSVCALLVVALLALGVAGCGGDDEGDARSDVRAALERLEGAIAADDYRTVCRDLLASTLLERLRAAGVPCETALSTGLGRVREPSVEVSNVKIDGDRATARVRTGARGQRGSADTVRLLREDGRWRIASLAEAG